MENEAIYKKLAQHLNRLPNRYPATDSGVELKILAKLFSPEQAELATFTSARPATAAKIAQRAGREEAEVAGMLRQMASEGLIFSIEKKGQPSVFMAAPFVIGIWEYHVNTLDEELIELTNEYLPILFKANQDLPPLLRTIPVEKSIQAETKILSYEVARELIADQAKFHVAPCICRKEHKMVGAGCDKLMEACLMFGWAAEFYERNGIGRPIDLEEALQILDRAEQDGLVLQPSNAQKIVNICCCCGDCCQLLVNLKTHPQPAKLAATAFVASLDTEACIGCGICLDRCQMDAFTLDDDQGVAVLDPDRCIGCGLCVTTCGGEALSLVRKPEAETASVPGSMVEAMIQRGEMRAKADLEAKMARHKAAE